MLTPLAEAVEAFLLAKRVAGCTAETLCRYDWWLRRFVAEVPEATALAVRTFFVGRQHLSDYPTVDRYLGTAREPSSRAERHTMPVR